MRVSPSVVRVGTLGFLAESQSVGREGAVHVTSHGQSGVDLESASISDPQAWIRRRHAHMTTSLGRRIWRDEGEHRASQAEGAITFHQALLFGLSSTLSHAGVNR